MPRLPVQGTSPKVAFIPTTPQHDAGWRIVGHGQIEPLHGHELGQEAEGVQADTGHETPLVQHPHHETRIDSPGRRVLRPPVASRADRDSLHDRGNTVEHRRDYGRDEADQHFTPPPVAILSLFKPTVR